MIYTDKSKKIQDKTKFYLTLFPDIHSILVYLNFVQKKERPVSHSFLI